MESLKAIRYRRGNLDVLDQLRLPYEFLYVNISTCKEAFDCIVAMQVRGAPAIAIVAALALAVELEKSRDVVISSEALVCFINDRLDYLMRSRPTAVDLSNAIRSLKQITSRVSMNNTTSDACMEIREAYIQRAEKILQDDLATNLSIGRHGTEYLIRQRPSISIHPDDIKHNRYFESSLSAAQSASDRLYQKISVLTHCNTGSLATSGHGTALGIIRSLHTMNQLQHAYCTETRPYNQGSRLTAFELVYESIPSTLITDSMAASLFAQSKEKQNIVAVLVGADRVARNGDTANKIGTYSLAILAKYHDVKFVVAAPSTSIDLRTKTGASIQIEDRNHTELTQISGAIVNSDGQINKNSSARVAIADQRIGVWNPAFDVTPASLISAIITEHGEVPRNPNGDFDFKSLMPERWLSEVTTLEPKDEPM